MPTRDPYIIHNLVHRARANAQLGMDGQLPAAEAVRRVGQATADLAQLLSDGVRPTDGEWEVMFHALSYALMVSHTLTIEVSKRKGPVMIRVTDFDAIIEHWFAPDED